MTKLVRSYTFKDGCTVTLRPLPPVVLAYLATAATGKPPPPLVWVTQGKKRREVANETDPDYIAALRVWEGERQMRLLRYIISNGVVDDPPDSEREDVLPFLSADASDSEIKLLWLGAKLDTEDDITAFTEAVMSQTMPTPEGLDESEAAFQPDGGRPADPGLPLSEPAGGETIDVAGV